MNKPAPHFQISVDPRIELLSIVLNFSEWPCFGKFTTQHPYQEAVTTHFGAYKNHKVVDWFNETGKKWNLDDPVTVMLWLSPPPEMQVIQPYPLHPTCQMSIPEFEETVRLLNEFARETNFIDFWEANQSRYRRYEQQIQGLIPYEEHIRLMVDFYGEEKALFQMIPAPLFSRVSFGPQLKTDEGKISHFITAFNSAENGQPAFSADLLRELIFHEFGHSFVNPVCETYRTEIFAHEYLFAYLKTDMSAIAYPDWFPTVHEHIVRTGESLLLEQGGYLEEARENEISNLRLGFALLPWIREKLACYAQNRERYPSFRSFFPELLKLFAEVEAVECQKTLRLGLHIKREGERYIVRQIQAESAGAQAGFQVGDALLAVNGIALSGEKSWKKVEDIWYDSSQGDRVRFSIERDHQLTEFYIEVPFVTKYDFTAKSKSRIFETLI